MFLYEFAPTNLQVSIDMSEYILTDSSVPSKNYSLVRERSDPTLSAPIPEPKSFDLMFIGTLICLLVFIMRSK